MSGSQDSDRSGEGPRGRLRLARRALGLAAWTGTCIGTYEALCRLRPEPTHLSMLREGILIWARPMPTFLGIDLSLVHGLERARARRSGPPRLIVANHTTPVDILTLVHLFGGALVSHQGVAKIPFFGWMARTTGTIFVDRENPKSGAKAIRGIRRRLKEGRDVIVFPEGTTFPGDEVREFKRGAFAAAGGVEAEILPVGLAYQPGAEFYQEPFGQHIARTISRRRTPVWVAIGEPRPVPKKKRGLEVQLREEVQSLVDRAAAARDAHR